MRWLWFLIERACLRPCDLDFTCGSSIGLLPALRRSGQILFQPSAVTGAGFLALVLLISPSLAMACLAGLLGATLCAWRFERETVAYLQGAGGFNGALVGLA